MSGRAAPAHVERVLARLRQRNLNPRPHPHDDVRWDAECPLCGQQLVLRDVAWEDGLRKAMLFCDCDPSEREIVRALGLREEALFGLPEDPRAAEAAAEVRVVTLDEFVDVDEPGAGALLGDTDQALIPENGDVMVYGDGGAGKTTLAIDLGFHLAAGDDWLGIPVPAPVRVLLIENEGPRPQLRRKLAGKRDAWAGSELGGRLHVFERPWSEFTLDTEVWRERLADVIARNKIDVLIVGPLTRIGMRDAGTLQDVVAFMQLVRGLRELCGRPLAVILVHHENKAGAVSGAWEGSGDTLLHVESAGNGHTVLHVQKARWAPEWHRRTLKLAWAAGESFELEGERDLRAEVEAFLAGHPLRTVREICAPKDDDPPGIGANRDEVKRLLEGDPEFDSVTGEGAKALGRSPTAVLWRWLEGSEPPEPPWLFDGSQVAATDGGGSVAPPLREPPPTEPPPPAGAEHALDGGSGRRGTRTTNGREAARKDRR